MAAADSGDEGIIPLGDAALDERLVAANAPVGLLEKYRSAWLLAHEAAPPQLVRLEYTNEAGEKSSGVFLAPGKTDFLTYAFYLKLEYKSGQLFARCRIAGCGAGAMRLTYDEKVKMKNYTDHIISSSCGPNKFVALKQWLIKKGVARVDEEHAEEVGGGGAAAGGGGAIKRPAGEARIFKSDAVEIVSRFLVMDTLPWATIEHAGFRYLSDQFGIPPMTRVTVKRAYDRLYQSEVVAPRDAVIKRMTKLHKFTVAGADFELQPWLSAAGDGWEGGGHHFMSLTATGAQVVKVAFSEAELRPLPAVLALTHFKAANYGAVNMAALFAKVLADMGIAAVLIFAWIMDTTAVNPAMLKIAPWLLALFIGCAQHKIDLVSEDLMKNDVFVDVDEAVNFFTIFFYGSEKRMLALLGMQADVARPLKPVKASATRFLQRGYQVARVVKLWKPLTALYNELLAPGHTIFDADTKKLYVDGYLRAAKLLDEIKSFDTMAAPFLRYNARMGSENDYTSSLQAPLFVELFGSVDAERTRALALGASGVKIVSMAETLIKSLFTRLAPVRLYESAVRPAFVPPVLPAPRRIEQLKVDDLFNAAALLDPACWATFEEYAGDYDDALAFIYKALSQQSKRVSPAVAPAVAAASKAALAAEIAAIKAKPKASMWVSDEAHAKKLAMEEAAARERFRQKDDAVAQAVALDEQGVFLPQLKIELVALKKLADAERERKGRKEPSPYGSPFDVDNKLRYGFWPKAKETMPLLFLAAWLILASIPAASTKNERVHSVSGRICCKFRAAMKAASVEELTLGYYYLLENTKRKMVEYAKRLVVTSADLIDLAELDEILADELPPPLAIDDAATGGAVSHPAHPLSGHRRPRLRRACPPSSPPPSPPSLRPSRPIPLYADAGCVAEDGALP